MASRKTTKAKHMGGRPPLPPEEVRRHRVVVHLTDAEHGELTALAERQDADLGAMAREILATALRRTRKGG